MNVKRIREIVNKISYKDWYFRVSADEGDLWLQVCFHAEDADTGEELPQHCRKWRLSKHMVDSEIIQTAFAAVERAEAHELRENFFYNDVRLFDPHVDLNALASFMATAPKEVRELPMEVRRIRWDEGWQFHIEKEICGSRGPRIGSSGTPYCAQALNHEGLHRGYPGSGFENETWGNPICRDIEFVKEYIENHKV